MCVVGVMYHIYSLDKEFSLLEYERGVVYWRHHHVNALV